MVVKNSTEKSVGGKPSIYAQNGQSRPPIVVVLGHVDHGKTTLISKIYEKDLTRKEFGGISQHIGAYQIKILPTGKQDKSQKEKPKSITFIDTPGHVAFSKMRSRGANIADLAVLVVAADEGVKPQTLESLRHIQEAKIPFLVAINKIDLPAINLDWVKKNLAENGVLVEGYGGNIVSVPVSAKTGQGISDLLEMIILLGEMEELRGDPQGSLEAVIIESRLDSRKGPLGVILIRNGSLRVGDEIETEGIRGKIKAMVSDKGENLKIAGPSQPVEVLGFTQVPPVGARVNLAVSKEELGTSVQKPKVRKEEPTAEGKRLRIILKTDVRGTLEAILGSLPQEVETIFSEVGNINESDVLLAKTTGARLFGFNVKAPGAVKKLAESEGVKIKIYKIIYEFLEELEEEMRKMLEPTVNEEILGRAKIIAEFIVRNQRVAGCNVEEGEISKQNPLHLKRGEKVLGDCQVISMKIGKEDVQRVKKGEEFGIVLSGPVDFKVGDMLISFKRLPQ